MCQLHIISSRDLHLARECLGASSANPRSKTSIWMMTALINWVHSTTQTKIPNSLWLKQLIKTPKLRNKLLNKALVLIRQAWSSLRTTSSRKDLNKMNLTLALLLIIDRTRGTSLKIQMRTSRGLVLSPDKMGLPEGQGHKGSRKGQGHQAGEETLRRSTPLQMNPTFLDRMSTSKTKWKSSSLSLERPTSSVLRKRLSTARGKDKRTDTIHCIRSHRTRNRIRKGQRKSK